MIEEQGRVVAVEGSDVWVETLQQSACGACSAKTTCGTGLISKVSGGKPHHIRVSTDRPVALGDQVVLAIPENALVKSALLVYGLPLLFFILVAGLAESLFAAPEVWVITAGLAGLVFGFLVVHWLSAATISDCQPVIVKVLPAVEQRIVAANLL